MKIPGIQGFGDFCRQTETDQALLFGIHQDKADPLLPCQALCQLLLVSNMQLSPQAMTRAIISATEGKSVDLQDLDIRSSYSGAAHAATGTGTDNMIVVEGVGITIDGTGGHTKMGELMAGAVYDGVRQVIGKQNGLTEKRSIFKQLDERKIYLGQILRNNSPMQSRIEHSLLNPHSASFMQATLAISDQYQRGLSTDLSAFDAWCQARADALNGALTPLPKISDSDVPLVIGKALAVFAAGDRAPERNADSMKE